MGVSNVPQSKQKRYEMLLSTLHVPDDEGIITTMGLDRTLYQKPPMPGLLLSNSDIDSILYQFESVHPTFKSFGAVPYDFSRIPDGPWKESCRELMGIVWEDFLKTYTSFGVVINLDDHQGPGNHWVCVYADVTPNKKCMNVEYFDSLGTSECRSFIKKCDEDNLPSRIRKLFTNLSDTWKSSGADRCISTTQNTDTHQKKNNECGMYCIYYIYNRLNGIEYEDGVYTIPDDQMTYFRNVLFDHSNMVCDTCGKVSKTLLSNMNRYGKKE